MTKIEIVFTVLDTHLQVTCCGEWVPAAVTDALERIRDKALQISQPLVLLDWRNVSAPKTEFHRFLAGKAVAELLPPPLRVAAVYHAELITGFAEDTAVNRGTKIFVCDRESDALRWLLDATPSPLDSGEA